MTDQDALNIVEELSQLKFFPTSPLAKSSLATKLMQWCEGDLSRARWLVDHGISMLNEYPGPQALHTILREKFNPTQSYSEPWMNGGWERTPPNCSLCGDLGTHYDPQAGRNVWCSCDQAQRVKADMPNWIDFVNRKRMPRITTAGHDKRFADIIRNLTEGYGGETQ